MSRLSGEFQTDLPLPDALAASAEAFHDLGWPIESVQAQRVISHAGPASEDPPTIEVELGESDGGTSIRIVGTDSEANPLEREALVTVLDEARDAVEDSLKRAEDGAAEAVDSSDPDQDPEPEPDQPESPEPTEKDEAAEKAEATPAGWYPDHYDRSRMQYWDGEQWTQDFRPAKANGDGRSTRKRAAEERRAEQQARRDELGIETAQGSETAKGDTRFRSLHVIAGIYQALAWLFVVLGAIAVVAVAVAASRDNSDVSAAGALALAGGVALNVLLFFGIAAAIRLALAVEENTRSTVELLKRPSGED